MTAQFTLGLLGIGFLAAALLRWRRDGQLRPAARTWLTIGAIFTTVGVMGWLLGRT